LLLALPCTVRAHDPGLSTAQGELRAGGLALTTGFAPADIELLLPASAPRSERWGQEEFEAVREHLISLAPRLWEIRCGGVGLPLRDLRVELLPGDNVSFSLLVALPDPARTIELRAVRLAELPPSHRQFVVIADGAGVMVARKLLSARDPVIEFSLGEPAAEAAAAADAALPSGAAIAGGPAREEDADAARPTFGAFLRLGVEHIWTGYDHLLFLFALLVVCRSFRSIVWIVTSFTLAHSLTLALATLEFVHLPARVVEPLIAATIIFVGVENLVSRGAEPKRRWALTFGFGLIHGFGFASVLRDLGVGAGGQGIVMPLFSFNLGVELGQVVIAVAVLPAVWRLRRNEQFLVRGVPALSGLVSLLGFYWLLERTVL